MNELSEITKIKILILENGIKFAPITLFTNMKDVQKYKMKTINKHPISNGKEVFDISDDNSLVPAELLLKQNNKESLVKCRFNSNSPVEMFYKNDILSLKINNNVSKVTCNLVPNYGFLKTKVNDEYCVEDYVDIVGMDRISILLYEGCYNWVCGKQCKFCDLHPKKATDKVTRPSINTLYKFKSAEEWWNFYKEDYFSNIKKSLDIILKQDVLKHKHLLIMAGNLTDSKMAWKCLLELTDYLSKHFDMNIFDSYANVCPQPDVESLKLLKTHGIKQVQYNLEVSNPNKFAEMCPGKVSYDEFKLKLFEAVTVFGKGNVRSNMVIGLQNFDELLKDTNYFAKNGIVFDYSVFQPKKHTPLENFPSPQMSDVIDYTIKLVKIYKTYNFKPIYCSISSRSSIVNEVFNDAN